MTPALTLAVIHPLLITAAKGPQQWRPGIGDPDFMGWFITFAYCFVGLCCLWAALQARHARKNGDTKASPPFWFLIAALLIALGINKQLDLQLWLYFTGKALVKAEGAYAYRNSIRVVFLILLATGGLGLLVLLSFHLSTAIRQHPFAVLGMALAMSFVLIRAAALLHFGAAQRIEAGSRWLGWTLELAFLGCLAGSALGSTLSNHVSRTESEIGLNPAKAGKTEAMKRGHT